MTRKRSPGESPRHPAIPFDPVPVRHRRDGWTPERQIAFIEALAACGCVREACRHVGMSPESAYELEAKPAAQSFRIAWQTALDYSTRRMADGAYSRAINGVPVPHYYQGELVGEHRRYDERLTMFLLRCRDPRRFGKQAEASDGVRLEEVALRLRDAIELALNDAVQSMNGRPRPYFDRLPAEDGDEDPVAFIRLHRRFDYVDGEAEEPGPDGGGAEEEGESPPGEDDPPRA
jgi:hypothetical protein